MINSHEIYWILQLDYIRYYLSNCAAAFTAFFIISILALVIFAPAMPYLHKTCWLFGIPSALLAMVLAFLPTTKNMVLIKVLPPLVNSDVAQQVPQDFKELYELSVKTLKENIVNESNRK